MFCGVIISITVKEYLDFGIRQRLTVVLEEISKTCQLLRSLLEPL